MDGRAAEAFVEERVFATEKRTGVLIFVALFEHRVVVLADEGIREQVPSDAWDGIARESRRGSERGTRRPPSSRRWDAAPSSCLRTAYPLTRRTSCRTSRGSADE